MREPPALAEDRIVGALEALLAPGLGEVSRRDAVEGFEDLFAPGNIVDLVLG